MQKKIIGDRIELRFPDLSMSEDIYNLINYNFSEFNYFLPWIEKINNIQDIQKIILEYQKLFVAKKEFRFFIFKSSNQELIGSITLRNINPILMQAELGFWLDYNHVGNGYVVEAFHMLSKEAHDIKSIIANTKYNNYRAIRTLLSLNFSQLSKVNDDLSFIKFF
ncbi:GNAT family N-acetyltransferase (plasmid) [Macrococcus psychrotolerans]|uniref:GNAT family N-acetyltransferase n=1 Tax=Macrococcus psychrotolerans TaxID=3039389 RepID=A0AAU6RCL3_9STAP